jgi:hypothetical protein
MPIRVSRTSDGFWNFPYPPDYADGRTNSGGINLVQHPERIEEITELSSVPSLRSILTRLNGPGGRFITLGFDAGEQEDRFDGYIEFAFRDPAIAQKEENYHHLLSTFCDWVAAEFPEVADSLQNAIVAELQNFRLDCKAHGDRLTLWFRTTDRKACDDLLRILAHFLVEKYKPNTA